MAPSPPPAPRPPRTQRGAPSRRGAAGSNQPSAPSRLRHDAAGRGPSSSSSSSSSSGAQTYSLGAAPRPVYSNASFASDDDASTAARGLFGAAGRSSASHRLGDDSSAVGIDTPTHPQHHLASSATGGGGGAATTNLGAQSRPTTAMLFEQLHSGVAASRARFSTASSSGWGSPRLMGASRLGAAGMSGTLTGGGANHTATSAAPRSANPFEPPGGLGGSPKTPGTAGQPTGTPVAAGGARLWGPNGINADGSFSVVRDEDDANGSGLLDLSPMIVRNARPDVKSLGGSGTAAAAAAAAEQRGTKARGSGDVLRAPPSSQAPGQRYSFSSTNLGGAANEDQSMAGSVIEHDSWDDVDMREAMGGAAGLGEGGTLLDPDQGRLLEIMRHWRADAMEHQLYDTAIFWGDKIVSLEPTQVMWNDAYLLAKAYFLTHRYIQAENLLIRPLRAVGERLDTRQVPNVAPSASATAIPATLAAAPATRPAPTDTLAAAVEASRSGSILPTSLLRQNSWGGGTNGDTAGKRKERDFTVSGNGTGSESNSADSGAGERGGSAVAAAAANGGERRQTARDAQDEAEGKRKVFEAWREEQKVALEEVRDRPILPPDGISLAYASQACRYLAAQCMVRQAKYHEALDLLAGWRNEDKYGPKVPSADGGIKLASSKWFLSGQIRLRLGDSDQAKTCFMRALSLDVKNYEAFSALIDGGLLGAEEQWAFIDGLEYLAQAGTDRGLRAAHDFIKLMYTTRLDKNGQEHLQRAAAARRTIVHRFQLDSSPDVLLGLAEECFAQMRFADAHVITSRIMELSEDHEAALPIQIASMYHLPHLRPALFLLAHHLTDVDPDLPAAWYAVGCWYASAKRWHDARRYFSKSVQLNPRFAAGWIAFAHSFALDGESDQAISSYSTASRYFKQSHLPRLFIGMEHLHQGSLTLATLFLDGSAEMWDRDPLALNERGLVAYHQNDLPRAIELFRSALRAVEEVQQPPAEWATTHLNLGFAYRKAGDDKSAKSHFHRVLELDQSVAPAYTGLGMVSHRGGDLTEAIGWYHQALGIDARDSLTTELLSLALEERASQMSLDVGLGVETSNRAIKGRGGGGGGGGTDWSNGYDDGGGGSQVVETGTEPRRERSASLLFG